jgi:hypothetical protein
MDNIGPVWIQSIFRVLGRTQWFRKIFFFKNKEFFLEYAGELLIFVLIEEKKRSLTNTTTSFRTEL